jgi:hypothetical protein
MRFARTATVGAAALAVALISACTSAPPQRRALLANEDLNSWHHLPGERIIATPNVVSLYPYRAVHAHVEGSAEVHCILEPDTRLHDCQVVAEKPAGWGFGEATVKAASMIRARPLKLNGEVVQRELIDFPFNWGIIG